MYSVLLQVAPEGLRIDPTWVITTLIATLGTLCTVIGALYRSQVAESKRKDELIDRLLRQVGRTADVTDRTVSLAERRQRGTDR